MKSREEIKRAIDQKEQELEDLNGQIKQLMKDYPYGSKQSALLPTATVNELLQKIKNCQNKLNHLRQVYFGMEEE
jgi:chromosome segregation ATPase